MNYQLKSMEEQQDISVTVMISAYNLFRIIEPVAIG